MHCEKLDVMQKEGIHGIAGVTFKKEKNKCQKQGEQIEQKQQILSSSHAFPLPAIFFNIHRLGRNLNDIDILILWLDLTEISRTPCSSSSRILTCASHICSSVHATTRGRDNGRGIPDRDRRRGGIEHHHHCVPALGTSSDDYWSFGECT